MREQRQTVRCESAYYLNEKKSEGQPKGNPKTAILRHFGKCFHAYASVMCLVCLAVQFSCQRNLPLMGSRINMQQEFDIRSDNIVNAHFLAIWRAAHLASFVIERKTGTFRMVDDSKRLWCTIQGLQAEAEDHTLLEIVRITDSQLRQACLIDDRLLPPETVSRKPMLTDAYELWKSPRPRFSVLATAVSLELYIEETLLKINQCPKGWHSCESDARGAANYCNA